MFGRRDPRDDADVPSGPYPPPTPQQRTDLLKSGHAAVGLIVEATASPQADETTLWQLAVTYQDGKKHREVRFADQVPAAIQLSVGSHVPIRIGSSNAIVDDVHLDNRAGQERALHVVPGQAVRLEDLPKMVIGAAQPKTWALPATCPYCGAPVDQAVQSAQADPRCHFCGDPLPVQ
jgi:hypothetical protein